MSYTLQEQYTSKNQVAGPAADSVWHLGARKVSSITIHHWGLKGQQFDTVRDFLCMNNTPTSAHYVAQDGLVACIVSPDDCAFHAGNAQGNTNSIGIECRPEATDGDYATIAELVRYLRSIYGDIPLYPHNHWYNTACPGDYDLGRIDAMARGGLTITTESSTITPLEDDVANTDLSLQENTLKVLTANKTVNGNLSVADALARLLELNGQLLQATSENKSTYYLKGDKAPEIYALDVASGKLRHVGSAEFDVVTAISIYKTVPQEKVDALVAGGVA